jgi:transcriptional antiterminator Rof (Rho-off)
VLSFSVITDDLTLLSKYQNVFCMKDYDHLKLACKPIFKKINKLCEKAGIEVEESRKQTYPVHEVISKSKCFPLTSIPAFSHNVFIF